MIYKIKERLANTDNYEDQWKLLQAKALITAKGDKAIARKMLEVHHAKYEMGLPLLVDMKESDFDIAFEIEFSPIGMDNLSRSLMATQDNTDVKLFRFCLDNNLLSSTKAYCFPERSLSWHLFILCKKYYDRTQSWPDAKAFTAWVKSTHGDEYMGKHGLSLSKVVSGFTTEYDDTQPWRKLWLSSQFSGKLLELIRTNTLTNEIENKIKDLVIKLRVNPSNVVEEDIPIIMEVLRA